MDTKNKYKNINSIIELKYKDFKKKDLIFKNPHNIHNILLFYLPSCKHCTNVVETWIEISNRFNNDFNFFAINCDDIKKDNDRLCTEFKVKQYPFIKYQLKGGKKYKDYKGKIDRDNLFYFICLYI